MGATGSRIDDFTSPPDSGSDDHLDDESESHASIARAGPKDASLNNITTTEFVWSFGGHAVYVTGAWDDWRVKVALSRTSPTDFTAILALPLGTFQYKFIVDGNWKHSSALPTERDQHGNLNNVVTIKTQVPEYDSNSRLLEEAAPSSPPESYNFTIIPQEDHSMEPPTLPRLLAKAPLDRLTDSASTGADFVRFNHIFATNSDVVYGPNEVRTMASELRYKSKVITTILIASKSKHIPSVLHGAQPFRSNRTEPIPIESGHARTRSAEPMGESQSLIFDALNNV